MTFDGRVMTTLVVLVLFGGACVLALGLPSQAAFMPLLIGVPGTLLCLWQLIADMRRPRAERTAEAAGDARSEAEIFLWLAVFTVALIGFGFLIGGPLVVAAFIRFSSRESWLNALIAGLCTFAVLWGVFRWMLELSLFEGLLLEWLF